MGGRCSQEFDSPMLEDTISSLEGVIMGWLGHVYGMLITLPIVYIAFSLRFPLKDSSEKYSLECRHLGSKTQGVATLVGS